VDRRCGRDSIDVTGAGGNGLPRSFRKARSVKSPNGVQHSVALRRKPAGHLAQAPAVLDHSLPQGDGGARPALAGGVVGGECNLIIFDAGDVLDDALAVSGPSVDAIGEMRARYSHL
jgi:hypothetical protein